MKNIIFSKFKRKMPFFIFMLALFACVAPAFAEDTSGQAAILLPDWRYGSNNPEIQLKIKSLGDKVVDDLPIPVLFGVLQTDLQKNFGVPRVGDRTHEGLDIMAPVGTPVVTPNNAVVTSIGSFGLAGNYIYTANPGGEIFGYFHLNTFAPGIKVGAVLSTGDIIGFVGKTGNAMWGDSHLHFEIRKDIAIDPYPRLTNQFNLEAKIKSLANVLPKLESPEREKLANFLVANYRSTFLQAKEKNILLPNEIEKALNNIPNNVFNRNLMLTMDGEDVKALQRFLNYNGFLIASTGVGTMGYETKTFGPLTRSALIRYQVANKIFPAIGYFGPITRGSINAKILDGAFY